MRIIQFKLRHKSAQEFKTVIDGDSQVYIIQSEVNSTGKTTLMRAILYSLGFQIPGIDTIRFNDYEFQMRLAKKDDGREDGERVYEICRKGKSVTIDGVGFDLSKDVYAVRGLLFGSDNPDLSDNILGAIYFDQDNGWSMFNRGPVVGDNRFDIGDFALGLNSGNTQVTDGLRAQIENVDSKIEQYSQVVKFASYQDGLTKNAGCVDDDRTTYAELEKELMEARHRRGVVLKNLAEINAVIKRNRDFIDYINDMNIYIRLGKDTVAPYDERTEEPAEDKAGGIIRVTTENLYYYDKQILIEEARKSALETELNNLNKSIARLEARQVEQLPVDGTPVVDKQIGMFFAQMQISLTEAKKTLAGLKKERKKLNERLLREIKTDCDWLERIREEYKMFSVRLDVPEDSEIDIMRNRKSSKSGTILRKLVIAAKMAYIKVLSDRLGFPVPIFCDSPAEGEVADEVVRSTLSLLKEEFDGHQIFIATIHDFKDIFPDGKPIPMDKTLFNPGDLLDGVSRE